MNPSEGEAPVLTHEDNQAFLQLLRENMGLLGIEEGKVDVRFEDVSVEADVCTAARQALPTLFNSAVNTAHDDTCSRSTWFWENNLVKSTGREVGSFLEGKVMYNGEEVCSSTPHYLRAYVSQRDLHHAEMTVRETINFSSQMLGTNHTFEMLGEAIREKSANNKSEKYIELLTKANTYGARSDLATNYIIKILGLSDCADTIIGDDLRRGISGGQKKRVTIGEMLVGFSKCFFMDDISTGLDSSTTFDIMKFLQQMTHTLELTMVISLLQPPPETFELFDDIILLCDGQIVYHGPRENSIDFFGGIGFKCPTRKNVADFLQEVTSKMDQKQYWVGNECEYQYHPTEKFVESFRASFRGVNICEQKSNKVVKTSKNRGTFTWSVFQACFSRELLLVKRNYPLHIFKAVQITMLAFVVATLFLRTEQNQHDSR
ncbi:hypothetical protein GUJ93_ZPchr0008g12532 [Zizania palustris]|uniref:ABC transporter domain-containing protein n=1 Tax=Zizania palustris TaxID=103762 RepID=A0A8J5S013_ZIZPA|nr:hypothetical protein GUJ93_ZPchr0008g12532 [Zizania palustris]